VRDIHIIVFGEAHLRRTSRLHLFSQTDGGPDIARLATIPHGDAVLALGSGVFVNGPPNFDNISDFSPLPLGVDADVDNNPYLAPYKQFKNNPFKNLFDPTNPLALLKAAVQGVNIKTTTVLTFDTSLATGGIHNIPFVAKQANASRMRAIFWIEELADLDAQGNPQFMLQYAQRVLLDFFPIGVGLIRWPHISINTMKLTARPTSSRPDRQPKPPFTWRDDGVRPSGNVTGERIRVEI
jgi:hypothetical protein